MRKSSGPLPCCLAADGRSPDGTVRLLSEVGLEEQTGGSSAVRVVQDGVDALFERDADAVGLGAHVPDALPERLVGLLVADALEHREQVAGVLARAGREVGVVRELELLELADQRALGAVDLLALLEPALLERRAQVAALPAARPEGLRA